MSLATLAARLAEERKYDLTKVILTASGPMCRKCWGAGRALWPTCCRCTGDVTEDVFKTNREAQPPKKILTTKDKRAKFLI